MSLDCLKSPGMLAPVIYTLNSFLDFKIVVILLPCRRETLEREISMSIWANVQLCVICGKMLKIKVADVILYM